jgi:hypothetical protein
MRGDKPSRTSGLLFNHYSSRYQDSLIRKTEITTQIAHSSLCDPAADRCTNLTFLCRETLGTHSSQLQARESALLWRCAFLL